MTARPSPASTSAPARPGRVAVTADVTDPAAVDAAVTEAVAALGGLDAVATVAGVGDFSGDVIETAPDEWDRVLAVNLTGMYLVARAAIPHLRTAGGGAIVTVSSQFGLAGCLASPAYFASKAGVIGLTKAMAIDHAREGIRVNCVAPGPVDTPMLQGQSDTPELDAARGRSHRGPKPRRPARTARGDRRDHRLPPVRRLRPSPPAASSPLTEAGRRADAVDRAGTRPW